MAYFEKEEKETATVLGKEENGDILNFSARDGPLTFQRDGAVMPGRETTT